MTSCQIKDESVKISVEKGDFGYIVSNGYPDNYTVEQYLGHSCNIEIRSCGSCRLKLEIIEVDFPDCPSQKKTRHRNLCIPGCDHLQIHEIDQPYYGVSKKNFHSTNIGESFTSISSNVRIRHCMSNGTVMQGKKFKIRYEVIEKREVKEAISSTQYKENIGHIESPNFPNGYALNGETFTYMLQNLDPYGHIRLIFDDWDISKESWIQVWDGLSDETVAMTFDRSLRPVLVSESSTLLIVFNTGRSNEKCCNHIGFKATYEFVSDCSLMINSKPGGRIELNHEVLQLPGLYDCVWVIQPDKNKLPDGIVLRLEEVFMGEVGCPRDSDYLCHNLWCIDSGLTCDGIDNCGDNSDESSDLICSVSDTTENPCSGNFRCTGDGLCIPIPNVCDRYSDCSDESDEIYC
ncbi:hypothetical protein KUTeg_019768, partial [Tegillarca granosa]